jgi:predicted kinase
VSNPLLVLISGLPGTGKTTLARAIACDLGLPILAKDRIQSALRRHGLAGRATVDGYLLMLDLADEQLAVGIGVVLDAVFPFLGFRAAARKLAVRYNGRFRPIYCWCSDPQLWQERLVQRRALVPDWTPVGWAEVRRLQDIFEPWDPEEALFLDAARSLKTNLALTLAWFHEPEKS